MSDPMNHGSLELPDTLVSGYVLGTLDPTLRALLDRARLADPRVDQTIRDLDDRLSPLLLALPPVDPPDDLFARIEARIDGMADSFAGITTYLADERRWEDKFPGVRVKTLRAGGDGGSRHLLLSLDAGAIIPDHIHDAAEECVVLTGGVFLGPLHLRAGDVHVAMDQSTHAPITSPDGALLYIRYAA